jgi:hypothetical protein
MRFHFHFSFLQVQRTKNHVQLLRKINDGDILRVLVIKSTKKRSWSGLSKNVSTFINT